MLISELVMRGKQELLQRGWCQGRAHAADGRVCAFGALMCAYYGSPKMYCDPDGRDVLNLMLRVTTGAAKDVGLGDWNDAPERTLQDVLDAFDAAIIIAQQHERAEGETPMIESPEAARAVAVSID